MFGVPHDTSTAVSYSYSVQLVCAYESHCGISRFTPTTVPLTNSTCANNRHYLLTYLLTYFMEQSLEKQIGSHLLRNSCILRNSKVHYSVYRCPPPVPILSRINQSTPHPHPASWRSILILSSHLHLGLPSGLSVRFTHQNSNRYYKTEIGNLPAV